MEDSAILQGKDGVILRLRAHPGAARRKIRFSEARIDIYMNSQPEKGQANKEAIRVLSKALGMPAAAILIVKGEKSRDKTALVKGIDIEQVRTRLGAV
ncbi:MAG: hypothetical protein A2V52_06010 [Actinobacteria bacterium RBG_19FT_COMBO_54_7]|uniref:UPF0235 protein A2Y75_04575 n=1 Tax=Candidatus Solincola sediminis TaxID=1797199 RepID=A0A1F2WGL1_9ACTN|nr:MAG: hypothetical protein A2Y75_04575 [Candidatus Solincola sediminis]OFW58255.1 MAG: hypothetical protein A2W01_04500 [Candidatus Solincola sediminis]OFW67667.1 MAG: hypothetical protein A2V52_06010 [Actinobacteria bacterium RBG_19FT_COMBO_54_7]